MGRHGLAAAGAVLLMAGGVVFARQVQPPRTPPPKKEAPEGPLKTQIDAAHALSWEEGTTTVTFLTGGVTIQRPDSRLHAGRVMLWKDKSSTRPYDELYAEGNVVFVNGVQKLNPDGTVTFKVGNQSLNCERFFYSNITQTGAIVDVRLKAYSRDLKADFFAMAKEARINNELGKLVADDVMLTSCNYGVPHYHLTVNQATLLANDSPESEFQEGNSFLPFGDDWIVDFDRLVPEFSGIPIFFLPGLSVGPWLMNFPIRTIRFGHSSLFGNFVYLDFGSRIRFINDKGRLEQWGDLVLKADWRSVRGEAGGLDLTYKWNGYSGFLDSYYLHDLGRRVSSQFEDQFPPLLHPDRAKVHYFHRQDLDEHWRYEVEAYYLSDRSLLEEFFPREFKELKEPETTAYVRWLDGDMGAFLEGRTRINTFQTQDEYLPRADFNVLSHPLLGGLVDNLYFTQRTDIVDIRRKFDDSLNLPSVGTWRLDFQNQISTAFDLRYLQISPLIQERLTYFQQDLLGQDRLRDLWTAGTRVTTQIHSTHPEFTWERVGIHGLRHVVEFEGRVTSNFSNNIDPNFLFPFEPVDQLTRFEEVSFQIRQRLLTKDAANKPFEFLNATIGIEYYPDSYRDTRSSNANNFTPPFDSITLPADPSNGVFERRSWSNLQYELNFHPRNFFTLTAAGEYNPVTRSEEIREILLTLNPFRGFTATLGQERAKGITDAYSLGITWELTPKWAVSVVGQLDARVGSYLTQELVVSRDFHDFALEGVLERDFTRNDNRYMVAFVPKFLGKAGMSRSHLFRPGEPVAPPTDR